MALNHNYGCGIAINAPEAVIPIRTIQNIAIHPNFGGEVLIVSLGYEKLLPTKLNTGWRFGKYCFIARSGRIHEYDSVDHGHG